MEKTKRSLRKLIQLELEILNQTSIIIEENSEEEIKEKLFKIMETHKCLCGNISNFLDSLENNIEVDNEYVPPEEIIINKPDFSSFESIEESLNNQLNDLNTKQNNKKI